MQKKITFFLLEDLFGKKIKNKHLDIMILGLFLSVVAFLLIINVINKGKINSPKFDASEIVKAAKVNELLLKFRQFDTVYKFDFVDDVNLDDVIDDYQKNVNIEFVEPNYLYQAAILPSDTFYNNQWYLKKIKAPEGWDITRESPDIVIAVIDSGVQIDHQDLKENIWKNKHEIANNGIDDDNNGFIDDINGWDFVNNVFDPQPKFKKDFTPDGILHGTIVSGIIAAAGNNAAGISGVTWRAQIMSLKVLDDKGEGDTLNVIRAIDYAIANKVDIINLSFVGFKYSHSLELAIRRAYNAGIIVVAAAGNEQGGGSGMNLDETPMYPVCYDGSNGENMVVGVAATDGLDQKAPFSGFGSKCIDVSAPGISVFSTTVYSPQNYYLGESFNKYYDGYWSGTSMAVPMVSGALALIESSNPGLTRNEVVDVLVNSTSNIDRLNPDYFGRLGSGRLNVFNSLVKAQSLLANKSSNLLVSPFSKDVGRVIITDNNGKVIKEIMSYDKNFRGGVNLAAGDVDGDGKDEIITGPGPGGGPHIKIFTARGVLKGQFFAYDKSFRGGAKVLVADIDGGVRDKKAEIITSPGPGGGPQIIIFNNYAQKLGQFFAYDKKFKGGVNLAASDLNYDGRDEIITGAGPGGAPHVRVFQKNGTLLYSFYAFNQDFSGGINVGAVKYK